MFGQTEGKNATELEVGIASAGSEAAYYGVYSKINYPLSDSKNYFYGGFGLTIYADFNGESEEQSYLKNDVDMRIIPNLFLGYNITLNKFNIAFELPIGTSIAITKGKLVNTKVDFEREYLSKNFLWHYGIGISTKYQAFDKNKIGLYGFLPLVEDDAWSPPMLGLSWIKDLGSP